MGWDAANTRARLVARGLVLYNGLTAEEVASDSLNVLADGMPKGPHVTTPLICSVAGTAPLRLRFVSQCGCGVVPTRRSYIVFPVLGIRFGKFRASCNGAVFPRNASAGVAASGSCGFIRGA